MNGISVMACVQTAQPAVRGSFGKDSRVQQKYIVLSSQNKVRRETGMSDHSCHKEKSAAAAEKISTNAGTGRKDSCSRTAIHKVSRGSAGIRTGRTAFILRTIVLALIFTGMLAGFRMMTRASNREIEHKYKYYTTVTVGYGEDLTDIVFRYCDSSEYENGDAYVREICEINSLPYSRDSVPEIRPGTSIVIPYYSTELK